MVSAEVKKAFNDIKTLRVQGATNVAMAALKSLESVRSKKALVEAADFLVKSRPTEPMMRNGLKYVRYKTSAGLTVKQAVKAYEIMIDSALDRIAEIGARRIKEDSVVMTHCHSSAVMRVLKKARQEGKKFRVIACEARPLFQGRITAAELSGYGIPVTLIVDSAMRSYVNDADLCLVGADAITADGHVVNKIGTSMLALAAHEARTEFGVASELLKFDPDTVSGALEPIEERDAKEVWGEKHKNVTVENPAFDVTPPEYISFVLTEQGILNPYSVFSTVEHTYRWMI
ncbi:MAG: S-methyl-5-thioribose-1-phosphate isomerase [archaeon]